MGLQADRNVGFKGEVNSADTPVLLSKGVLYSVESAGALKVTAGGNGDRAITVAPGAAWGDGVLSTWDTGATLNPGLASGSDRWDTVVVRRTWQPTQTPTGTAEMLVLAGGASRSLSPNRTTDRGVTTSDQPIALVLVRGGSATVSAADIVDLRVWSGQGGGLVGASEDVLQYLAEPGTAVRIGGDVWTRLIDGSGVPYWSREPSPGKWQSYTPTVTGFAGGTGYTVAGRYTRIGDTIHGRVVIHGGAQGVTGQIEIGLPVAMVSTPAILFHATTVGNAFGFPTGAGRYEATVVAINSTRVVISQDGGTDELARWRPGVPGTWDSTGRLTINFTYEGV